jgi:hypothetical protein
MCILTDDGVLIASLNQPDFFGSVNFALTTSQLLLKEIFDISQNWVHV